MAKVFQSQDYCRAIHCYIRELLDDGTILYYQKSKCYKCGAFKLEKWLKENGYSILNFQDEL